MIKLSCVIPCYNEEDNILPFFNSLSQTLEAAGLSYELLFVDDGSRDGSLERLRALAAEKPAVRVIRFSRNFGKEAAMYAGLRAAKGDYVSIVDADLQQPPEVLLQMVNMLEADPELDCVAAFQKNRRESGPMRFFKGAFYGLINRVAEIEFVSGASDFRTLRRNMVDALNSVTEYYRFSKGLFSWVGFRTEYIPYEARERASGKTKFSFWKLLQLAFEGIIAFTTMPLKLATVAGLLTAAVSVIYLVVVVLQKLIQGIDVPGYATIVVLILLLGGMQLFFLGVIGEYLARMYIQTKNRPVYIIKETFGGEAEEENKD